MSDDARRRAIADQRRAAEREAREVARGLGLTIHGNTAREVVTPGPIVTRLLVRSLLARQHVCEHLIEGGPRPTYAVAWEPGVLVCEQCVSAYAVDDDDPDQWTCDGCGTNAPNGIAIAVVRVDRLIMCAGLCRACRAIDFPGVEITG